MQCAGLNKLQQTHSFQLLHIVQEAYHPSIEQENDKTQVNVNYSILILVYDPSAISFHTFKSCLFYSLYMTFLLNALSNVAQNDDGKTLQMAHAASQTAFLPVSSAPACPPSSSSQTCRTATLSPPQYRALVHHS